MDIEFDIQYRNLLIHHLDREEVEYELKLRGIEFTDQETRSVLVRRLKEKLKTEKASNNADLDFTRLDTTVDEEISIVDQRIKDIADFLSRKKKYEGNRIALKTRLVHYFARVKRLTDNTDNEDDLNDIDTLQSCIRGTYNTFFSVFSSEGQQEIVDQINQSMTNLAIDPANPRDENKSSSSSDEEVPFVTPGKHMKRKLTAVENVLNNQKSNNFPSYRNQGPYSWMFGLPQMQMWAAQKALHFNSLEDLASRVESLEAESRGGRKASSGKEKVRASSPCRERNKSRPRVARESSDSESGGSTDRSHRGSRNTKNYRRSSKGRPVADWRLRYDGADNGQSLTKFIREVEFYAKSEKMSNRELFRSAIHLFTGSAKSWFMSGVENEDFTSWEQLKEELKREFLSPDHDHTCELRAGARRQGPRERFQDYYLEMQTIFNAFTKPMTERKKFDIVFRNMRADYKGLAVSKDIDNLADLKRFGRKLDATYWFKYQPTTNDNHPRAKTAQVNEVHTGAKPKTKRRPENDNRKTRHFYNTSLRSRSSGEDEKPVGRNEKDRQNSVNSGLTTLLNTYQPPKEGYCFNCRLKGHHARDCTRPKHKYCLRCGFHNVETATCPFCEKNATKTVSEGRHVERL